MPPRRRGDVSAISLMRRAFVAATSERRRSAVAAMSQRCRSAVSQRRRSDVGATSQRCRNDVADDNAPLGIAPLGHRTYAMIRALRNGAAADIKHFASKLHFPNYIHTPKESNYLQNECSKGHLQGEALGQRSVSIPVCIDI